jgi:hypothetical protein
MIITILLLPLGHISFSCQCRDRCWANDGERAVCRSNGYGGLGPRELASDKRECRGVHGAARAARRVQIEGG